MNKKPNELNNIRLVDDHDNVEMLAFVTADGKATVFPRDIFISHAGEDKDAYARPLNRALNHLGISTWFDEAMIQDGDSLTESVGQGLSKATLVVLLITENFMGKGWPEVELRNALSREIAIGVVRIIPIVDVDHAELVAAYPLIEDKRYRKWDDDVDTLAISLRTRIGRESSDWHYGLHPEKYTGPVWTRITPRKENMNTAHTVTIIWGQ